MGEVPQKSSTFWEVGWNENAVSDHDNRLDLFFTQSYCTIILARAHNFLQHYMCAQRRLRPACASMQSRRIIDKDPKFPQTDRQDWSDSDCIYAHVDLSLCWAHMQFYSKCRASAIVFSYFESFEPAHEIIVLFVLRKLILLTRMCSHPVGLAVGCLVWPFMYFHTSCERTVKALARLRECAGSPEPSLVAYVISTIISWAGSFWVILF